MLVAVLLTCHNRKEKTLQCLDSLFAADIPDTYLLEVYLVDDGSTDGTSEAVRESFPRVNLVQGNGSLFWAGGMRLAFNEANKYKKHDGFLLLNDDVILKSSFFSNLLKTREYCIKNYNKRGVYAGATSNIQTGKITYGGNLLTRGLINPRHVLLTPDERPQKCHLTNANILFIEKEVIEKIGFFDERFSHGVADYDFSLRAIKSGFPVYLAPNICGYCDDDHGNNWSDSGSLSQRIEYLKSPLGLAYDDYLFYARRHFPVYFPIIFAKLWLKTLFPFLWNVKQNFKNFLSNKYGMI